MNIVVVGDGKVGYTLTASLSKEGHDVTVIDNRPDTLRNTTNFPNRWIDEKDPASAADD